MTKTNVLLKNGFFFIIMLTAMVAFTQNSPCLPQKMAGYTMPEIVSAYKAGKFQCDEKVYATEVARILQADATAQGVKFKAAYGGGPATFSADQPTMMDSVFKYTKIMDGKFVVNYGWDPVSKKFDAVARDPYAGEKGLYFDYNSSPYFEGSYKPVRYGSNICVNLQEGEKPSLAKTTNTTTDGNTTTTTTTERTPEGDVNVTVTNTNTNTNTNTSTMPAPPSNMLPTQSYNPGSSYCVADGMCYPQGNSQGQWCEQSNGQMCWVDWANLFLNAADLAVDIWSLWKLYDLAGTPETVIPPTVYNYYTTYEGDEITNNYYGDEEDPDLPGNGDDDGPDLPDNGPDLPGNGNGKMANEAGKFSNPFGGDVVKKEPAVAVNQISGNVFGGSASAVSPIVETNKTVAGNIFGAGVSTPSAGINTSAVLNDEIALANPVNVSTGISNPFGGAVAVVEVDNLSGIQFDGVTGIKNPVNISANQIVLNPSTNLPVTNVIEQNGSIAVNGVPTQNGIQIVDANGVISGPKGNVIQPAAQNNGVTIMNGNAGGTGIKPITINEPVTVISGGNQGGVDKNIVASQQQYSIGSVLTGVSTGGVDQAGGLILNTGVSGKKINLSSVGTGKGIKIK